MVLLGPALRALRHGYEDAHITLEVRPQVATMMERHPYVDTVVTMDRRAVGRRAGSLLRQARVLRGGRYDAAVVWHPTSVRSALLACLAGIPVRVGHRVAGRQAFLTKSIADTRPHETERYLRILSLLDDALRSSDEPSLYFWHDDAHREVASRILASNGVTNERPIAGIHLGTTWPTKEWLPKHFAEVAHRLGENGARIVITGSSDDLARRDEFASHVGDTRYVDLVGQTDLFVLAAVIERCGVYVTADSGPMHIAAAVGTPVISIFGPTSPGRHGPLGERHHAIQHPLPCVPCYKRSCRLRDQFACMRSVSPDDVLPAASKILWE